MDCRYGNKLCTVFGVEVLEIREMLEVVCVELAAVYNVVRLNVVGIFLDVKRNILLLEYILYNRQNFGVRCRRSRYSDFFSLYRVIVD